MRSIKLLLLAVLPALLAAACSTAPSAMHYYVLNPVAAKAEGQEKQPSGKSVSVLLLHMPQYLDRQQIVTRRGDNELLFADQERWGGNLRKNVQQVLNGNLAQLLAATSLSVQPADSNVAPDMEVELEISRFERFADGKVYLTATWQVVDRSAKVLSRHASELSEAVDGSDYDRTVAIMSRLLGRLSGEIADALQHKAGNRPAEGR